jgi:hypothetical protein
LDAHSISFHGKRQEPVRSVSASPSVQVAESLGPMGPRAPQPVARWWLWRPRWRARAHLRSERVRDPGFRRDEQGSESSAGPLGDALTEARPAASTRAVTPTSTPALALQASSSSATYRATITTWIRGLRVAASVIIAPFLHSRLYGDVSRRRSAGSHPLHRNARASRFADGGTKAGSTSSCGQPSTAQWRCSRPRARRTTGPLARWISDGYGCARARRAALKFDPRGSPEGQMKLDRRPRFAVAEEHD